MEEYTLNGISLTFIIIDKSCNQSDGTAPLYGIGDTLTIEIELNSKLYEFMIDKRSLSW